MKEEAEMTWKATMFYNLLEPWALGPVSAM